ncbi:MAG: SRPBCC domain-containing protein [Acidimicrobiales bacterium]
MTENRGAAIKGTLHSADGEGVVRVEARCETDIDELWSALTDPQRLARWYGNVDGDLRVGGEFTAFVYGSEWEGRGRIDLCDPPRHLRVIKSEEGSAEEVVTAELGVDGDNTTLVIEVRGLPLDKLYAYGAGWQAQVENLVAHLARQDSTDAGTTWVTRWDELAPSYREMTVVPLAH